MKLFIWILLLTQISVSQAKPRDIMVCLGAEELQYHKKKQTGPLYRLNRNLISHFLQFPKSVIVKPKFYKRICNQKKVSQSLLLFETAFRQGKNLFSISNKIEDTERLIAVSQVDTFIDSLPQLFLVLVRDVQALAPSAGCLEKELPRLKSFFLEIKYLQSDIPPKQLFDKKSTINEFFRSLPHLPVIYKRCWSRIKSTKPAIQAKEKKSEKN